VVQGFTPDGGEVLFTSQRDVHSRSLQRLFRVSVAGGFPSSYDLPSCSKAALSPDGSKIAYLPLGEAFLQWKNYRGGRTSRIWVFDIAAGSIEQVPQPAERCNDTDPMWIDGRLFFRSDRAGEFNLFSYDFGSKAVSQRTYHEDFPVLDASNGAESIVYEQAGWLHRFNPNNATATRLSIGVAADLIETRPRFVKGDQYVRSASISPSAARVAFGYRGEIITLPAKKGDPRNLTETTDANERYPAWSPDGKTIAYYSDESGENQLVLAPQSGHGERRFIDLEGAGFYESPSWSPDGKRISYVDNARALYVLDVESGLCTKVAQEPVYGVFPSLMHNWSPDSRWLAYTLVNTTGFKHVELYDADAGESHAITDGLSDASEPVFDAGGKYLYLAASTDAGPFLTWFSQASADVDQTNSLYLIVLDKDTPSPFAKESDEEPVEENEDEEAEADAEGDNEPADEAVTGDEEVASKADSKADGDPDGKADSESDDSEDDVAPVQIDFEGLSQRIVALPLPPASYTNLVPGPEGQLLYLKAERQSFSGAPGTSNLARFDLTEREETTLLADVQGFDLSASREKALIATTAGYWIAPVAAPVDKSEGRLAVESMEVKIDPRAEWKQIFDEVWRINRDYFYDPDMHGADWPALKIKYGQFLPHLTTRGDLNRVIRWLCSELTVGHSYSGGGDTLLRTPGIAVGLLGADYEVADGRYRFAKVLGGLNWTPDLRAPLTEPGVDVNVGDYLLAVDGHDLQASDNLYSRFENRVGKQVELTVGPNADGSDSRTVKVVPVSGEGPLRNRDWVEGNIRRVTEASDGRVAYVHVPDTADRGFTYFKRYFFPQSDREGIIIDERHNGGGSVADYYIDILRRPYVSHWATRYGESIVTPQAAIFGPKVMLIDETAGSGGDLLPWMFREFGLGKLIGRRTWGGLVGILGFPELMDGGFVTSPNIGFWTDDEGFGVENEGVAPDIEVEQLPSAFAAGLDPQLERAIAEVLAELEASPTTEAVQPPFPVRARR